MSKLGISTGSIPNDGTGDTLLQGALKINSNFDEVYSSIGDGSDLVIGFGKTALSIEQTTYNVGLGSTIPSSKLDIIGDAKVSGVITATNFVGELTGNSTGLLGTPNITVGEIIASEASFSGNVSIAGTLTYEDVTSIDALGIITARSGIELGASGAGGTITGSGDAVFIGIVTAASFSGDGSGLTGVNTTGYWEKTSAGINTLTNVGIGTTNPVESLTVSGVTSSTSFYGDASYTVSGRWVLSGDGSNYSFTGVGITVGINTDPILYLARGRVYEFENTQPVSHPFQIRVSSGGTEITNGITSYTSGSNVVTRYEIPFNAPSTLYYQCTVHSGMGNTISIYPSLI